MAAAKDPIRRVSQALWDCGMQVSLTTRAPGDCERFDPNNPEFGLSLMDARALGGDDVVLAKLETKCLAKMLLRDAKSITAELATLTRERHGKYGYTLFHLEPNIKDCPGGLRDANVCHWLARLKVAKDGRTPAGDPEDFREALSFLAAVRCFLHYRHERDDNTLDWQAQDGAAEHAVGLGRGPSWSVDAAYWMRAYFRHARIVERRLSREMEGAGVAPGAETAGEARKNFRRCRFSHSQRLRGTRSG